MSNRRFFPRRTCICTLIIPRISDLSRGFLHFFTFCLLFFPDATIYPPSPAIQKREFFGKRHIPRLFHCRTPPTMFCSLFLFSSKRPLFGRETITFSKLCTKILFICQKAPILISSSYCSWIDYFACRLCAYPVVHCVLVKKTVNSSPVEYEQLEITVEPNPKEAPTAEPKSRIYQRIYF